MNQRWTVIVVAGFLLILAFCQAIRADNSELKRLQEEGEQAYAAGNFLEALAKSQNVLALTKQLGDRQGESVALGNIGEIYRSIGQYDRALEYCRQTLAIGRELKDHQVEGTALNNIGAVYEAWSQYNQALEYYQQALAIRREVKDRRGEGDTLNNIGVVYEALSQYNLALEYYQQTLAIARELKDSRGEGTTLNNMGVVYRALGQPDRALEHFQQALVIAREVGDRPGEGNSLNSIGVTYDHLGQPDQALEHCRQALAIKRALQDRAGEGTTLNNMGLIYDHQGQYDQALNHYRQALVINREIKDRSGEGTALHNIGAVYRSLGQYDQALEHYQQSLAISREVKDRAGEGATLNNIGLTYRVLGQYERALEYHRQALAIAREVKQRAGEGATLDNIGAVYRGLGQPDQALEHYQQALVIAREVKQRAGEGTALSNIGEVYKSLGQDDRALENYRQALVIAGELGDLELKWHLHVGLGMIQAKQGHNPEAVAHYDQALDDIETLRGGVQDKESRLSFMRNKLKAYDGFIDLLLTLHSNDPGKNFDRKALEIFERKQGRLFLEEMGRSGARNFAGLPEQVKSQEAALEQRLDTLQAALVKERSQSKQDQPRLQTLETQLQQAKTAFQTLKGEMQTKYPDYHALKYPQPVKLAELQTKVLKPGEVMLIYGVLKDKTCLWVIGKEVCRLQTLPIGEQELGRKIAAFRRTVLKTGDTGGGPAAAQGQAEKERDKLRHELYSLLFPAQVLPAPAPGGLLYIIPTGPLYSLPFEALETQAPGQPPHYLVEDYAIAYLSSASLLKTLREAQARKQVQPPYPLLAFANPRYEAGSSGQTDDKSVRGLQNRAYREIMGGTFPELPETEDEARAIQELLKAPEQSKPLIVQEAASRSTLFSLNQAAKLSKYRYLVFACHGILPGEVDRVVQPALVLAYPEKDGFLTMGDVFGLQLNAELVSLSACNTGRGSEVKGEGVLGLTRAFMYAGTQAVSVTLWSVESQSAKELNVGMYRYLSQKHGRAAALREIKLALLRGQKGAQYRDPFFWAPLVVFGDGQ